MQRREFCRTVVTAAALGSVGTAAADGPYETQPDHVTLTGYSDASADIDQYRPLLVTRHLNVQPATVYAWRATSAEYDYDWYCYWVWYPVQQGATDSDSHVPDREPVYVAVGDDGDVDLVVFDQYHYLVGQTATPPLSDNDRPQLRSIKPWHNYQVSSDAGVDRASMADMHNVYEDWQAAGWGAARRPVVDPPSVLARGHWWESGSFGVTIVDDVSRAVFAARERTGIPVPLPGRRT